MSKPNYELAGKTIVITGASSGAGRAAALAFAQQNAALVLAARNEDALNDVAEECLEFGAEVLVVPMDVTDPRAMISLANTANDWKNGLHAWINNAGVLAAGPFDRTPIEIHMQVVQTNLLGYMNGAHAVIPLFKAQGHGVLINNISIGGFLPVPYGAGYTASKFGLRGFSEALKAELTPWPEIYVCDLFPAFLDTPGILHAANYTGKVLKPAPPVYDPKRVAQAMVAIAKKPDANTYVGSVSYGLKFAHALFPELMTKATGFVMRRYFKSADPIASTSSNLYNTVDYGMATNGGFGLPGEPKTHRKYIVGALSVGLALGFYLTKGKRP
ncbi:SDR family oxidoreductase [Mucilaginibacter sp. CAU 1740]|uniref:SDR family oxidoreductase n=1 Tax=Mucilaginibacter sp. CAU 1740 TaxID=3140365 RepID=UPI00325AAEBC